MLYFVDPYSRYNYQNRQRPGHPFRGLCVAIIAMSVSPIANAGGFQVREQSALGLGRAYSGEAVAANDSSGLWYNPAQAVRLSGLQGTTALSLVIIDTEATDIGSTIDPSGTGPIPVVGQPGNDPLDPTFVPAGAGVWRVADDWALGFSFNAPFGLVSEYDPDFFGRYDSIRSDLLTIDVSLSLAHQLTDQTSIGGSFHVQYVDAELTNALPDPLGRGPTFDGLSALEGDDVSFGWSVGILHDATDWLSVGLSYRSEINHDVSGNVTISNLSPPIDFINGSIPAAAELNLPDSARLGVSAQLSKKLQVTVQAEWVGWSDFESLDVELASGTVQSTPFDYQDRTNVGIGADYQLSNQWTVRTGFSYDPTPIRDGERSTRVPDADRYWITGGFTRQFGPKSKLDVALAYIFVSDTEVDTSGVAFDGTPIATPIDVSGELENRGFILSAAFTKGF